MIISSFFRTALNVINLQQTMRVSHVDKLVRTIFILFRQIKRLFKKTRIYVICFNQNWSILQC